MHRLSSIVVVWLSLTDYILTLHHALPECTQIDECSCRLSDGKEINIRSLGDKGQPRFPYQKVPGKVDYEFTYNPCYDFSDKDCKNVIACQRTKDLSSYIGLGTAASAKWGSTTGSSYTISYEDSKTSRSTVVQLECAKSATTPKLEVLGAKPGEGEKIYFTLTTDCACPGKCQGPSPTKQPGGGGLSPGSIISISFAALFVVYLVVGALFMKFVRGAVGQELIPNVEFWISLPGYIKDGFLLILHPFKTLRGPRYDEI